MGEHGFKKGRKSTVEPQNPTKKIVSLSKRTPGNAALQPAQSQAINDVNDNFSNQKLKSNLSSLRPITTKRSESSPYGYGITTAR